MQERLKIYLVLYLSLVTAAYAADITSIWVVEQNNRLIQNIPVTFGHVFVPGDIPAGTGIEAMLSDGTNVPIQVDAKATHPDGSLRHAVITILLPKLNAGETKRVGLVSTGAATATQPMSIDDLLGTDYDAVVRIDINGQVYTASAREILGERSQQPPVWLSGELVTEWLISSPVTRENGEQHPHLTARFHIRAYRDLNYVRTAVILENNWAYVPQPSGFQYDVAVSIGGGQVYSKTAIAHSHHARWRKVFWWSGNPDILVKHNLDYLISTHAIPNYDREISISSSAIADMQTEFEPMSHVDINPYMPETGAQEGIGPLPRWTSLYLLTMDPVAKKNTLANGDAAASYQIHYRDKTTDLPVTLDDYPYMTELGNEVDTYNPKTGKYEAFPDVVNEMSPYYPDDAHQPSAAFIPYVITGDYYFLEELQFWANWNMLIANPYYRSFEKGLLRWAQPRAQAWSLRTLGHVAYITPDAHPLKNYFVERVHDNVDYYTEVTVDNPEANLLGYLNESAVIYDPYGYGLAPWQDDFFTWAVGYLVELGFSEAYPLFRWKSKFLLGRMASSDYCWLNASTYSLQVFSNSGTPLNTFGEVYQVNFANAPCRGTEMEGYPDSPTGFGANLQPALALITDAAFPGTDVAWNRYETRNPRQDYSSSPQFAVVPRNVPSGTMLTPPVIVPPGGTFTEPPVTISLYCSIDDADIYYTLDGSQPDEHANLYDQPIILKQSAALQAIAFKPGMETSQIAKAEFIIISDLIPPEVVSVTAFLSPSRVVIVFSEPVGDLSENESNYDIDRGVAVLSATLDTTDRQVTLLTSQLSEYVEYTLSVSNITDQAQPPNTIAADTHIIFTVESTVGVELSSFEASYDHGVIELDWTTASETTSWGFNVLKCIETEKNYQQVNDSLIKAIGTSAESHTYRFKDDKIEKGRTYFYRLQQLDVDGHISEYGPVSVLAGEKAKVLPGEMRLYKNYPNPFNLGTIIKYDLPNEGFVKLEIFDVSGKHVRVLVNQREYAGQHLVRWDGANSGGEVVSNGTYFYRLSVGAFSRTEKMVFLK